MSQFNHCRTILLLLTLNILSGITSQAQTWNWAEGFGSDDSDIGRSIALAPGGSFYVTGTFDSDTLVLGSDTLINTGGTDLYVLKIDSNGNVLWAKGFGSSGTDRGMGITADALGNAYVTGSNSSGFTFGSNTLSSPGTLTFKISSNGAPVWAKSFGTGTGLAVCMIDDTSLYFTGNYGSLANFAPYSLPSAVSSDLFVAKLDTGGQVLLAYRGATGSGGEGGQSIHSDSTGRVTVVGVFDDDISFAGDTFTFQVSFPDRNAFIAQFEPDGSYRWAEGVMGPNMKSAEGVAMDNFGYSYLSGFYLDTLYLASDTFLSSSGGLASDLILAKFDSNGVLQWLHSAGGSNSAALEVEVDQSANVYLTGRSVSPDTFDTIAFSSSGFGRVFVAKYSALGNAIWVKKHQTGVAISNDLILGGNSITTTGSFQFGSSFDSYSISSNGSNDILAAQLSLPPCPTIQPSFTFNCFSDSTMQLTADTGYVNHKWSDGQFGQTIEVADTGTYYMVVQDSNGCTGTSAPQLVEVSPPLTIAISDSLEFCAGGSATLNANDVFTDYLWSTGSTSDSLVLTQSDTVTLTVTDALGCTKVSELFVTTLYDPQPAIVASGTTDLCEGENVTLSTAQGYDSYAWTGGSTAASLTVSQAGTYNVTVTEGPGCTASASAVPVSVTDSTITITADGPLEFCEGDDVTLSTNASGVNQYTWSNAATTSTTTITQSTTVSLAVVYNNGCPATSNELVVTVHPNPILPTITRSWDTLSVPDVYAQYQWYLNGSPVSGANNSFHLALQSGGYSVVVWDANDCSAESVSFDHTVGIEASSTATFKIYPNPNMGLIYISSDYSLKKTNCSIFNLSGELVKEAAAADFPLDIHDLSDGTYFVEIRNDDYITRQPFVLQR